MEKYFVNYNQSLALKELGFDIPCMGKYDTKQGNEWFLNIYSGHLNTQFGDKSKACIAPLKSQVFEWFREKYNWHNVPLGTVRLSDNKVVYNIGKPNIIYPYGKVYDTYEEAESACIDNLIENAKNK
jgi:hypothetical protein